MAKRELIDKNEIPFSCRHDCWTGNCIKCDEKTVTQYEINEMSAMTEEEIVKPYLEKLKAELIAKYPKNVYGTPELGGLVRAFSLKKLLEMIDNLLI